MDVNGDGRDDRDTVRKLIETNGGVIDCEVNAKGEIKGTLVGQHAIPDHGRRYATDKTSAQLRNARTKVIAEADRLGIQPKKLKAFLEESGWRNRTSVVALRGGGEPRRFSAQAAGGRQPGFDRRRQRSVRAAQIRPRAAPAAPTKQGCLSGKA